MNTPTDEKINLYINAWYNRTLPVIDLDNGGKEMPPLTREEWEESVKKDFQKLIDQALQKQREEVKKELRKILLTYEDEGIFKIYTNKKWKIIKSLSTSDSLDET